MSRAAGIVRICLVVLLFAALQLIATPVASASTCTTSGPVGGSYTVEVCIDSPLSGDVLSGDYLVSAHATESSASPGIRRYVFFLDGEYLLTDFNEPVSFELPTEKFIDGPHLLEVEVLMRDDFTTDRTGVSVSFANGNTTTPVNTNTFTPSTGVPAAPGEPFVVAFTGDGGDGQARSADVAAQLIAQDPNLFAFVGDMYEKGSVAEYHNWYDGNGTLFGALKDRTNPVPGNHEYVGEFAHGYYDYWDNIPEYYSYDANGWHFIALNSTILVGVASPQYAWLVNDLATNTAPCTVAYVHHPMISVGPRGGSGFMDNMWTLMANNGVDVVVTGHDHSYQRWVPLDANLMPDPNGIVQFITGAGGHGIQGFVETDSRLAQGLDVGPIAYGALELSLNPDGAEFVYRNIADEIWDSGTVSCDSAPDVAAPTAPQNLVGSSANSSVELQWERATDNVGVTEYQIYRDGTPLVTVPGHQLEATDTTITSNSSYTYSIEALDAGGNTSLMSNSVLVATGAPPTGFTFTAIADSYVNAGFPDSNYGSSISLRTDLSPGLVSYLKFNVTGLSGPITNATLRVTGRSNLTAGYNVRQVANNSWQETLITHNNAPTTGAGLGSSGPVVAGATNDIDVTSYITTDGVYSFAAIPLSYTNLKLASREHPNPPELIITTNTSGNLPPTATDIAVTTDQNVAANWIPDVADPNLDPLTCVIGIDPTNGTATVASDCSTGTYTPNSNYSGTDTFTYQVTDGTYTTTATVNVTINNVNQPPVADPQNHVASAPINLTLTSSDPDNDCPQTITIAASPTNGTLSTLTNPTCTTGTATADITYTPNPGHTGTDTFTFTTTDPQNLTSTPATITIDTQPPPTEFTFTAIADSYVNAAFPDSNYGSSISLRTDLSPGLVSYLKFNVTGLSGPITNATLRVTGRSNLTAGYNVRQVANNSWQETLITHNNAPTTGAGLGSSGPVVAGASNDIDVTSYITTDGLYSFAAIPLSYTNLKLASREHPNPPELIITTNTSGNLPPTAADVAVTTDQNVAANWVPDVADPNLDPLTCVIGIDPTEGTATVANDCSTGTYTPNSNYSGTDTFTYQVNDGTYTTTATVNVTINNVNQPPVADPQNHVASAPINLTLTSSDPDNDCPQTITIAASPTNGTLSTLTNPTCTTGTATADITYTPNPGHTGTDTFTFTTTDPQNLTSTPATITIDTQPPPTEFTFAPVDDAYVNAGSPNNNYGNSAALRADLSPGITSYLKFDVTGLSGPITNATLRITGRSNLTLGYDVAQVADNTWLETSITHNSAPATGANLGTSGPVSAGNANDIDVTAYILTEGIYSFAVIPLSFTNLSLASSEHATPPQLIITTNPG